MIPGRRARDHLILAERIGGMRERYPAALRRIALAPVRRDESPTDLQHRTPQHRVRRVQSDEADEWRDAGHFDGPEAEALLLHPRHDPVEAGIGFLTRADSREVLHDSGVRVHRGERRAIAFAPRTKQQALGSERDGRRHRSALSIHAIVSPMTASASGSLCISCRSRGYTRRVTFSRPSSEALDETRTIGSPLPWST